LTDKEIKLFDESEECGLIFLLNMDLYRANNEFEKVCNVDKNDNRLFMPTFLEMFETIDGKPLKGIKSTASGK